jgi:quinoprotein relay system zinc metallohydrolase 1
LISRTTSEPVVAVIHLNLHPDYFLGNQAFADVPRRATAATRAGMALEAKGYEDNLYRLCGDWMAGTEALLPDETLMPGTFRIGEREIELREYRGHTQSDLVLIDRTSGTMFAGGLVFVQRIPTTPHAQIGAWQQSLQSLSAQPARTLVPSHGPVRRDMAGIAQTQRYLQWLDQTFRASAEQGLDMNEVLRIDLPAEFSGWAAAGPEYIRNVAHLYPRYEQAVLGRRP